MSAKKTHHLIVNPNGGWDIKKSGSTRTSGHFDTKREAIKRAKEICTNQKSELVIYDQRGKIVKIQKVGRSAITGKCISPKTIRHVQGTSRKRMKDGGGTHSTGTKKK